MKTLKMMDIYIYWHRKISTIFNHVVKLKINIFLLYILPVYIISM